MSSARIGETGQVFGTTDETYGYITDLSINENVQEVESADGDGEIQAIQQFGKKTEASFTYTFRTGSGAPTLQVGTGTPINLTDTDFNALDLYVKSAVTNRIQNGFTTVAIEATSWPEVPLVP